MDEKTFEALGRLLQFLALDANEPSRIAKDWHQVDAWMQEVEKEINDEEAA
jgi:hypothetical protein